MTFELNKIVRENVLRLVPYSSARSEFNAAAEVWLDANENSFGSPIDRDYNRYPDPLQAKIKERVAKINSVSPEQIFVGNGSDEAIDLVFRIFCRPGVDNIIICPPTYGMYEVSANINDIAITRVPLTDDFSLDVDAVKSSLKPETKIIFICSPNNPTGNLMERKAVIDIAKSFDGIVVVDEAYIHFAGEPSLIPELEELPNLIVLQTFSKAWGLAGLRVGLAFASKEIVALFNKVKPPYNVSEIAQETIITALDRGQKVHEVIDEIKHERATLKEKLAGFPFVETVYSSDANFLLVKVSDANALYRFLIYEKIVVRNRSNVRLCEDCLRITVGTHEENARLFDALGKYSGNSA